MASVHKHHIIVVMAGLSAKLEKITGGIKTKLEVMESAKNGN